MKKGCSWPSAPADSDEAKRVYYLTENRWVRA